jgi:hypothetical protein
MMMTKTKKKLKPNSKKMSKSADVFFETSTFDYEAEKQAFKDHMDKLKDMSVEESVFYKKWMEIKNYRDFMPKSEEVKAKIWRPSDINNKEQTLQEIRDLKPRIFYVEPTNKTHMADWLMIRVFCHTMAYEQTPGRFIRFLVIDDNSQKYLGAVSISNDVMALTCRDNYIGWTSENRIKDKRLIHSAIGSCIMGTQPFGYNFLGGKLVASLILSQYVRDTWKRVVGKTLVGMTTTSLYGPNSMYCGIPYWHGCGCSAGKISIKPDDSHYETWHKYIKENRADEYERKTVKKDSANGPVTGVKQRILEIIFRELGISASKYNHGFERGVYYAPFYDNTKDFLCNRLTDEAQLKLSKRFEKDSTGIIEWWREKALKRYSKLHDEGRIKGDILYYNKMIDMSYTKAKKEFFGEVGR